jgi:endonuclease-8
VEILWGAGLAPERRPCDLDDDERSALAEAILDLPRRSYRTRGKRGAGHLQDTPFRFRAYERGGEACPRCLAPIEKSMVASRPFYACLRCQR